MAFIYLKFKSAKCLCLLPVVLVLRNWPRLHHCSDLFAFENITAMTLFNRYTKAACQRGESIYAATHAIYAIYQLCVVCLRNWINTGATV